MMRLVWVSVIGIELVDSEDSDDILISRGVSVEKKD